MSSTPPLETLQGTIERFVFQNTESGFAVVVLLVSKIDKITVTGSLSHMVVGQEVTIVGTWQIHKKFGRQFSVQSCTSILPTSLTGLKRYLGSGLIKGIGKTYAEKLVEMFKDDVLTVIDQQPHRLARVPGIGPKRIAQITAAWQDQKAVASIMVFLQDKGISPTYAVKIYKQYHHDAITVLQENPYRLADDIWGIGFKTADAIAQKIGIEPFASARIKAGILFCLSETTKQGSLYSELSVLQSTAHQLLTLADEHIVLVQKAVEELLQENRLTTIYHDDKQYVTLPSFYHAERSIAERIRSLLKYPSPLSFDRNTIEKFLNSSKTGIMLNKDQQAGVISCLLQKVTIITGGPGTGKTTLIKQLLALLDTANVRYKLAAPTGRAAKRIFESTKKGATTIHRLLEFDMQTMQFKHQDRSPLDLDMLIVDEASMIDTFLAHALLKAVPPTAHLVLLGDVDQLPSVGPGTILQDLMTSGIIPTIRLTEIFRQARHSLIIVNAHRINQGQFPYRGAEDQDFVFIQEDNPEQFMQHVEHILFKTLPNRAIPCDAGVVLCPMNRGSTGTQTVNVSLQTSFNGATTNKIMYGGIAYKLHDKVMQIRNNYDKMVFNGDVGILQAIDHEAQTFTVNFDDRLIPYDFDEINELVLAYALTIHKSQGSEYPVVIVPLFTQHFALLQRNLIYTAITRAKQYCVFIGQIKALALALKNNKSSTRLTFLKKFLQ